MEQHGKKQKDCNNLVNGGSIMGDSHKLKKQIKKLKLLIKQLKELFDQQK
jgi:phosphoserine aminotransferase